MLPPGVAAVVFVPSIPIGDPVPSRHTAHDLFYCRLRQTVEAVAAVRIRLAVAAVFFISRT